MPTALSRSLVIDGADDVLVLAKCFGSGTFVSLPVPAEARERVRAALIELATSSMISDVTDTTFRMHELSQAVERGRAEKEGFDRKASNRALDCLTKSFEAAHNSPTGRPICDMLIPHQWALVERLRPELETATLVKLLDATAAFYVGSGYLVGTVLLFRRALESSERQLGAEHPHTITSVNNLAYSLRQLGDVTGALPLFKRAAESSARVFGPDDATARRLHHNFVETLLAAISSRSPAVHFSTGHANNAHPPV